MRIYVLCGLAFAGKSTLAHAIAQRTGAETVSLDTINEQRALRGGLGIPESEWAETHRVALRETEAAIVRGAEVVVDDTNCYRFLRNDYRALAGRVGAECLLIYVDVPLPLTVQRLRDNEKTSTRHPVTEAILLDLARRFEAPEADEPHLTFSVDMDPPAWIDANLGSGGFPCVG